MFTLGDIWKLVALTLSACDLVSSYLPGFVQHIKVLNWEVVSRKDRAKIFRS